MAIASLGRFSLNTPRGFLSTFFRGAARGAGLHTHFTKQLDHEIKRRHHATAFRVSREDALITLPV
jgi:hypothetical protein